MADEKREICGDFLPTEIDGVKFQPGWYYLVDKKSLEPYINESEKDSDYRSIEIFVECFELDFSKAVKYTAEFFTDVKQVGVSGTLCEVTDSQKNKAMAKKLFLEKLHKILSSLELKPDLRMLAIRKKKLEDEFEAAAQEIKEIGALLS